MFQAESFKAKRLLLVAVAAAEDDAAATALAVRWGRIGFNGGVGDGVLSWKENRIITWK